MAKEAWSRWGEADERGAINLIGPEQVRDAASLVQTGQTLSLAQPLSSTTIVPEHRVRLSHFMSRDGGDYAAGAKRPGGFQFAEDVLMTPLHIGTHIDALCHVWYDDLLFNGHRSSTVRSTTGAARCGIEKLGPVLSRGVLYDVARWKGRPLRKGEGISATDLRSVGEECGLTPRPGDIALVRTGWQETCGTDAELFYAGEPGLDVGAGLALAEAGISMVGADNFAVEVLPSAAGAVFPLHQRLIRDHGLPLLEGLMLQALAEILFRMERWQFLFVALPLPIIGGTASPVMPVAVL